MKSSGICVASTANISIPNGYISSISRCTTYARLCVTLRLLFSSYKLVIGGNKIISTVDNPRANTLEYVCLTLLNFERTI